LTDTDKIVHVNKVFFVFNRSCK